MQRVVVIAMCYVCAALMYIGCVAVHMANTAGIMYGRRVVVVVTHPCKNACLLCTTCAPLVTQPSSLPNTHARAHATKKTTSLAVGFRDCHGGWAKLFSGGTLHVNLFLVKRFCLWWLDTSNLRWCVRAGGVGTCGVHICSHTLTIPFSCLYCP